MVLFKFGAPEHLEQLRKTGLLFMKSSTYFSDLERSTIVDPVRADRFEGSDWILHPKRYSIDFEGPGALDAHGNPQNIKFTIPPDDIANHTLISFDDSVCNIYCMYGVTEPRPVDEENFKFGASFVIILNTFEFLRRFTASVTKLGLSQQHDLVEYYELDKYSGGTGPFRKPPRFAFQNEFRLVVRPGIVLRKMVIGNLEDITSEILPLPEINRIVDLSPDSARKAGLSW
jgi:hypothetical protein